MRYFCGRKRRGSASIEFAGAMIMFALVMVFILQAGAMMVAQVAATNAAREGARAAVTRPAGDPVAAASRTIEHYEKQINVNRGLDSATVTVRIKTPMMFQVVSDWNLWVQGRATMRQEQ
jgi:Flp pilus assembly protein TadG